MGKRKDTLELEKALERMAKEKRWYGCEEITIGFANNGHGNEICDYILMDSKGTIRCYELKVTKQDLKSHAKKSWYGNYNYLVVSTELLKAVNNWNEYIPDGVGLMVGRPAMRYTSVYQKEPVKVFEFETVLKPKRQEITPEAQLMIAQSMVRSMMYKIIKYKNCNNLETVKGLESDIRSLEKRLKEETGRSGDYYTIIRKIEWYLWKKTGIKIHLVEVAEMVGWK